MSTKRNEKYEQQTASQSVHLFSADWSQEGRCVSEEHGGEVEREQKIFVTNSQAKRSFTEPKGN